ncbi:MAG: DUF447 domain-containing protein [Pirellulales bacterium]
MTAPLKLPDAILLEGIVTTDSADGSCNISPMGPIVDWPITRLRLRPFQGSTTFANLRRTGRGVLNVTDDVELIACAAIGQLTPQPPLVQLPGGGRYLANACRWYDFKVESLDDSAERTDIECHVVGQGTLRDFFGFNRAKHAVIEAAILATRVGILPENDIRAELHRLAPLVEKTGSRAEHRGFRLIVEYVDEAIAAASRPAGADA